MSCENSFNLGVLSLPTPQNDPNVFLILLVFVLNSPVNVTKGLMKIFEKNSFVIYNH